MGKIIDLTGKIFGRLQVIKLGGKTKQKEALWLCKCKCGKEVCVRGTMLTRGRTKSCGCLRVEKSRILQSKNLKKHGMFNTNIYKRWIIIRRRCYDKNNIGYKNYGGRGVRVCDDWNESFESFYNWAVNNGYKEDLTIDRIDVDGNYEPSNCRWISKKEQARNRRTNKFYSYKNKKITIPEISEITGINKATLYSRKKSGWSDTEAFILEHKNGERKRVRIKND